jgi:voltage-gated potassium channel
MLLSVLALGRLLRSAGRALADPTTRGLVVLTALILLGGTSFYATVEGWSVLDASYFSVVTLTTIGFGDLTPVSDAAKVFTMVYSLVGIGVLASFVASIAIFVRQDWDDRHGRRHRS